MEKDDLKRLDDSPYLLDLLIQVEDVLDSLDTYVFLNWFDGEIAAGPTVRRYWIDVTLRYDGDKMPDPRAARRMLKNGVSAIYEKHKIAKTATGDKEPPKDDKDSSDENDFDWLIKLSVPRRLIEEMNAGELDLYDDQIDADDVQDAADEGMTSETEVTDNPDEQPTDGSAPPPPQDGAPEPDAEDKP